MNLVNGKILSAKECETVLADLKSRIESTLIRGALNPLTVINAIDKAVKNIEAGNIERTLAALGLNSELSASYLDRAKRQFGKHALRLRLKEELGTDVDENGKQDGFAPPFLNRAIKRKVLPLGVLLHIAAGNADGLPAFSVLEGLLTGNINILKLPAAGDGVSVAILQELIAAEPVLSEYIYVFDYSSKDIVNMKRLIDVSDAVAVWGGTEAVKALRALVPPNVKLIEWGHKVSFCYVDADAVTDENLTELAKHMAQTDQLLCSSAQGVFVDGGDMGRVYEFCERFLPVLEKARSQKSFDESLKAKAALEVYNAELEQIYNGSRLFKGKDCSIIAYEDGEPASAIGFCNVWAKPLPREKIVATLRPYKNFLQTAGLICLEKDRGGLTDLFFKTGAVRVCPPAVMSDAYCLMPHDGEYPLRRYTKIVTAET